MNIPTPDSLRATRRPLARRVGRLEKAELVLAEMRAGAALHLQHTRQRPVLDAVERPAGPRQHCRTRHCKLVSH